ncbi:MAG TPA: A/G-specific adenine glycosylase [Ktedonobacterales bacterium]|nr:A/G-specific adenine glycosylase [Ktedonobacterales bacterium]
MTNQQAQATTSQPPAGDEHPPVDAAPTAQAAERRDRAHAALLAWYAREGRAGLPWRATRDPYAILVSEVMLQQTQVERVIPKYLAFLARFPTLAALAEAPTADVIREWAGLGYNMRAVRLQEVARQAQREYGGQLPSALDDLMRLKGVGRYTAGAVAAFAFEQQVATVDTNIRRTLWRILRGIEPAVWPAGERAARETLARAEWALPPGRAYDWQQALMDLGATICIARRPACERCPLQDCCAAWAEVAAVTLFPSGEALAHLRDERAVSATPDEASDEKQVAETGAPYAATPRRRQRSAQQARPFTSTTRYFRGRIIAALRALEPGAALSLGELGPLVKPDYGDDDRPWLRALVDGLARDGLARLSAEVEEAPRVSLP